MRLGPLVACGLAVSILCSTALARTFEIKAWRGETAAALVPDFCELGEKPDGITLRFGILKSVRYAPKPRSVQRLEAYDLVAWDVSGAGPRIVEVSIPTDARPGTYDCGAMRVTVLDRNLPPPGEWKYYLDLWQHPWAVARYFGVKPFSPEHYAKMRPVYELLASAGQKTITVSLLDEPWDHQCYDAYHSMFEDGDFRIFDEYVEFCRSCGLGPYITCYSLCPWRLKLQPGSAEFDEHWGAFLDRFAAHLKEKGWFGQTLMAMDERAPEQVKAVADFVRRHAPGLRISMAGNRKPSDFHGIDIDFYSQHLRHFDDSFLDECKVRRDRGFVTTHYVCCSPAMPNTFLSSGEGEAFWCGTSPAMLGLDGFLRWAWNSWPQDPYTDASYGDWLSGDTFLCYPNGEPSWRFLELRNGIVAAEKIRILRACGEATAALDELKALYDVKAAVSGKAKFHEIRRKTLSAVN